jgi:hypothetical protein
VYVLLSHARRTVSRAQVKAMKQVLQNSVALLKGSLSVLECTFKLSDVLKEISAFDAEEVAFWTKVRTR